MASALAVSTPSTPPPPGTLHTPNTPRLGYGDPWEPYSPPRRSARLSSNRTPSPISSSQPASRTSRQSTTSSLSKSTTPAMSPRKKRAPAMDSVRRASGVLTAESTSHAAEGLGLTNTSASTNSKATDAMATTQSFGMPTPAKTPRKQPDAKLEVASRAVARNLFATEADILSPKKKSRKSYSGIGLNSFIAEDVEENIEIFTDSIDRVPEVDTSAENPFYGPGSTAPEEPTKRRSKRKITIPGEGKKPVEEVVGRDDGMLYVFRGKRVYRKFSETHSNEASGAEDEDEAEPKRQHRMTRASIKPRRLFAPTTKGKEPATSSTLEDEEAMTDIEVADHKKVEVDIVATPVTAEDKTDTPKAPRFAPASPPSTTRVTRSVDKLRSANTPVPRPRSPFDGWRRSKSGSEGQGQKRDGEPLARPAASSKRARA
ncbi:hypothetical protein F5Y18DRAFT_377123 [Xylariaceae sp. FL1019]|nr:hypothetical protein F5Y18DRAFT_377123 [Xylariaceae sp. FL1019]